MRRWLLAGTAVLVAFGWGLATPSVKARQAEELRGTWTAAFDRPDEVHLTLREGRRSSMTVDLPLEALQGLSQARVARAAGPAAFRLIRPAGTIHFEGEVGARQGEGTYRFVPDRAFLQALEARGYTGVEAKELLVLALHDVDLAFVDHTRRLPGAHQDVDDLVQAAIFDVSAEYVATVRRLGFEDLTLEELVQMRIFDIDAAFLRELAAAGLDDLDVDELVQARVHGIDAGLVRTVREMGYDPTLENMVQLQIFDIDAAFIEDLAEVGYRDLTLEELVQLRIFDIDRAFITRLSEAGLGRPSVERLLQMKIFGQEPEARRRRDRD